jgi:hypothetical protein
MEIELIAASVGLMTVVGGGGVWLGVLHNRVTNNEADIQKLVTAMNGHLKEFNTVVTKVAKIELTCDNIYSMLDKQNQVTKRNKNIEDGPEG